MNDKIHICHSDTINIYTVRLHSIIPTDFNGLKGVRLTLPQRNRTKFEKTENNGFIATPHDLFSYRTYS